MRPALLCLTLALVSCGNPVPFNYVPNAELPPPELKVTPPPGPFNGSVTLKFETVLPATVYVSVDGKDPRTTSTGRLSGPSPFTVTLDTTTSVKFFASVNGKDSDLQEGQWIRAGGPVGTISGVVVVGSFAANRDVAVNCNAQQKSLPKPTAPGEIPFSFTGLASGTYRLSAMADRNGDGNLTPFIDFTSDVTTITLDLTDPFKASAEDVHIYLGASATGLGTLRGTISLPNPPPLQNLQISVLSPDMLGGGVDPQVLLTALQGGYRIITTPMDSEYPYVITNLKPAQYVPVPSLIGFGAGGGAMNFLANPLRPVTIEADQETVADYAFGPVTVSGTVTLGPVSAPTGLAWGMVAGRAVSFTDGIQAVLMPVLFTPDGTTGNLRGNYAGSAIRSNTTLNLRVFTNANMANPITDALAWVVNPFSVVPAHGQVLTGTIDVTKDLALP